MKITKFITGGALAAFVFSFAACNNQPAQQEKSPEAVIKEESITYNADSVTLKGFVAYNDSSDSKRPAVLVVHEWWGLTDYPKMRAKELAKLGYIAMAIDMYGEGKTVDNPDDAGKMATPFYTNPALTKARFDAALAKLKSYPQVDTNNIAAIGYCFGGAVALNVAKMGENLKGVVSFHGSLSGVPANKDLLKAKILVCHGADDVMVNPEVETFKKQMDSINADYVFKSYPNATHAFTNPAATEKGKKFNMPIAYNREADSTSWADMREFFGSVFSGEVK